MFRLKALAHLQRNLEALRQARGYTRRAIALRLGKHEGSISKFFKHGTRPITLDDLDKLCDLFGVELYELFLPGVGHLTERRTGQERRHGKDRRTRRTRTQPAHEAR
jgi:transcriptional regulator with XRE-family HTH domain